MDDLKRKSFIATGPLTQGDVTSAGFAELLQERFAAAGPMMTLLCAATGVKF